MDDRRRKALEKKLLLFGCLSKAGPVSSSTASLAVSIALVAFAALAPGTVEDLLDALEVDELGFSEEENFELRLDIHEDFGTFSVLPLLSIPGRLPFGGVC